MKILVTGAKGQLGYDVCRILSARGIEHIGTDLGDFDITDRQATLDFITFHRPDAVIHCSGYTAVDKAEDEADVCFAVNADGTRHVAEAVAAVGAKMMYISTDYVFDGTGSHFHQPDDPTAPLSVYGRSKLIGEKHVAEILQNYFIVRISWLFGINGSNFVNTMLRLSETRDELNVVNDQIGSPTYSYDLARLLCDMIVTEKYGIYHATNEGICSWAELASMTMQLGGRPTHINPIPSSEYPTKAKRPLNSRLSKEKLSEAGFLRLPDWKDALARYLEERKERGL